MKKVLLLLFILMLLVVGCITTPDTTEEIEDLNEETLEEPLEEVEEVIENMAIEEWCIAGTTYNLSSDGNTVDSEIVGIETYKGKEFCKVEETKVTQDIEVKTTYYFTYEEQEMWILTTVTGQTTEKHIIDGELVE